MPVKPSEKEEEFFAREELDRKRKREEERIKKLAAEEKGRLKELHYMKCPKCGMDLNEINFKGVNIDKCLNCEGIWLDAGELNQISKMEKGTMDKLFSVFKK